MVVLLAFVALLYYYGAIHELKMPVSSPEITLPARDSLAPHHYRLGPNWVRKNAYGIHELYVEGSPYQRGIANGALTQELIEIQEKAFTDQIRVMIPSDRYLFLLKYLIGFMNRDLEDYVRAPLRQEIYGVSQFASPEFNWIGKPYARLLNYHAAHDIGHALQNMMLVGCTSFGVWDRYTEDGSLLLGRNFDFWVGDAFAEQKILAFVKPDSGYGYVSVCWGGFVGVVSGMNDQGLTVTINAAPGSLAWKARTPVSLVAREILQFASNLEEAQAILAKRPVFVSESFLIGSAKDGKAWVVEKTPDTMALYQGSSGRIQCTNFYQATALAEKENNKDELLEGASAYRYQRLSELVDAQIPMDPGAVAKILRDKQGIGGASIGMGNEKAINQFIAHHAIIFQPDSGRFWISTDPWQMGAFLCYDLHEVLNGGMPKPGVPLYDSLRLLPADPFLQTPAYDRYQAYRKMRQVLLKGGSVDTSQWLSLNPHYYETYELAGDFAARQGWNEAAQRFYQRALDQEIPRLSQRRGIEKKQSKL